MTAPSRRAFVLLLIGLVLLSANPRPAAVSVGPLLAEVRDGLGMSTPAVSLLTSLPVLAFAAFGALAPAAARIAGVHRVTLVSLLAVVAGLLGRAATHSEAAFLLLSMLALAGMAMANVLLPSLVAALPGPGRHGDRDLHDRAGCRADGRAGAHRPDRRHVRRLAGRARHLGRGRACRGAALDRSDRPRRGDGAGPALDPFPRRGPHPHRLGDGRLFGLQSMHAYAVFGWFSLLWRENGYSPGQAGALVGLVAASRSRSPCGSPGGGPAPGPAPAGARDHALLPRRLPRADGRPAQPGGPLGAARRHRGGDVPDRADLHRAALAHAGGHRRAVEFTQSMGYLLAAVGPFGVGTLNDLTGGWTAPLLLLIGVTVPQIWLGLVLRPSGLRRGSGARPAHAP